MLMLFSVTPLDVVKIRLQQQAHPFVKGTCFLYYNGLMDHLCTACADANSKEPCEWFARPGNFTGTRVSGVCDLLNYGLHLIMVYICTFLGCVV